MRVRGGPRIIIIIITVRPQRLFRCRRTCRFKMSKNNEDNAETTFCLSVVKREYIFIDIFSFQWMHQRSDSNTR